MSLKNAPETARSPWSLAARLTTWYAGSAFLLLLAATGFLYWALEANLDREDDQFLADKVQVLRVLLRDRPQDTTALRYEVQGESSARPSVQIYVRILDPEGRLALETPGMDAELPADVFPEAGTDTTHLPGSVDLRGRTGKLFRGLATRAAVGPSGAGRFGLQVAFDRTHEENLLARYRTHLWTVLGLALVACALAGYQIARRGLRPLAEMTQTARRIRSTTLDERMALSGLPAELAVLAGTFNEMLDRLEESFQRLARFSADIAHELRTPVNNLRGEAEVALGKLRSVAEYRDILASSLEECVRLSRLIDSLLFLARAESSQARITRQRVQVGHELAAVRDFYEAAATESRVTLTVRASDTIVAEVDRTLFQQAVGNLVTNALAHTPPGGTITLSATAAGNQVRVEVADTGRGISREHLPHVFDRFYRVDPARSTSSGGVGLGLALVHSIMALHQGSATITSAVGRGTCVRLVFPGSSS